MAKLDFPGVEKIAISIFVFLLLIVGNSIQSQISSGGVPKSMKMNLTDDSIETLFIQPPDLELIGIEDSLDSELFLPRRFCVLLPVKANLNNSGSWFELPDGSWTWRLKMITQGALATSLYFDDFKMGEGDELFLYDESGKQVKGSFTTKNNHQSRLFATELIYGNSVIVELNCAEMTGSSSLQISEIGYAYRDIPRYDAEKGFGGSDFCEINIGCSPEGTNWQNEKNGVVRIQVRVSGSGYWCTGSLINNTSNDNTPYILTADHCAYQVGHYATASDLNQWLFYFKYEAETCVNPVSEPTLKSMTGASKVAQGGNRGSTGSDFYLLLLNSEIPGDYNSYFMGWAADNAGSSSGVTIHHPQGDIKKVSTYTVPPITNNWSGNGLPSHWKVFWTETENGWGVTEGGSSGSPLLDEQGRIIGTLTGGFAACESSGNLGPDKPDYYGKFSYHWQSNGTSDTAKLEPWLDPENTGITVLNGKYLSIDNEHKFSSEAIHIFPNPSSDYVYINFINFDPSNFRLEIFDVLGNLVKSLSFKTFSETATIDIRDLTEGVYLLGFSFDQFYMVKRFVRQKKN